MPREAECGPHIKRRLLHIKAAPATQAATRAGTWAECGSSRPARAALSLSWLLAAAPERPWTRSAVNTTRPGQGTQARPGHTELQLRLLSGLLVLVTAQWLRPPHWPGRVTGALTSTGLARPADTQLSFPAVTRLSNTHSMSLHNKIHPGKLLSAKFF